MQLSEFNLAQYSFPTFISLRTFKISISLFISAFQPQPLRQLPKYWTFSNVSAGIFNILVWLKNLAVAMNFTQILSNSSSWVRHLSLLSPHWEISRTMISMLEKSISFFNCNHFLWNVLAGVLDSLNVIHEMYLSFWTNSICL